MASESHDALTQAYHSSMMAKADSSGRLPIIVRLKTNSQRYGFTASSISLDNKKSVLVRDLRNLNSTRVKKFQYLPIAAAEVDSEGLRLILNNPDVAEVYEDKLYEPHLLDSAALIGSTTAANSGVGGAGQVVAILDTGVDRNHPFLAGKVVHEACFSRTTSIATSICPNGSNNQVGTGAAQPCASDCNHGTHVAGIAAGKGDSFSGVAPDADIMAIQVFSQFTADDCSGGSSCVQAYTSDILSGLEHVYSMRNSYNIASINMSLGGGLYSTTCDDSILKSTIDLLKASDIATVIASGNDGLSSQINSPACISSAISVGATTKNDTIASYSNSSEILDLLAPGTYIQSSIPGTGYGYMSGTSMATPHVAGAFAVMRSKFPTKSVNEILTALKDTGTTITDSRNGLQHPRIQIDSALTALTPFAVSNDFNPDGKADIFWRNDLTGQNQVLHMNGANVIATKQVSGYKTANWKIAGIGDLNGDSNADIVWRNEVTSSNIIDIMNGTSIASSTTLALHEYTSWNIVGIDDFDGDGKDDLLWKNKLTGEVRISFMNGSNLISDQQIDSVGLDWQVQAVGDFNGDSKSDILWRNKTNGRVWMYLMNGSTVSATNHIAFTSLSWDIKDVGDFNGDGKDDILWKNNENGRVWIYLMNGISIANGSLSAPGKHVSFSSLDWDIKTASDFNGDGKDDILWRNNTTGENWMYLMNGTNISTNKSVNVISNLQWTVM